MDFCPHCMRPATGPTCPHCGKPVAWQAQGQQLPLGTRLTGSGGLRAYATGAVLGQGGFGITYIAREVRTSQRVAIKECFPAQCAQRGADRVRAEAKPGADQVFARAQNSFLEEAKLLACQDALPAIVHVIDFFRANNTAYLVMEFLDGVTLEQKRRQAGGRLSAKLLLPMLRPLLRDLGKLHESGVIHRDISPDNLMWMPDNTLKLLDFGCARSMEDGRSMSVLLKHGFAPVEQYQTRGQGPETDIYALSATIYFCLTATMPPASVERLEEDALYLLDEPENSLSPARQLELAQFLSDSARFYGCQLVISTHSPFLLALEGARIYDLDQTPAQLRRWTQLDNVRTYHDFFRAHEQEFKA